jgi:hypothetical protein
MSATAIATAATILSTLGTGAEWVEKIYGFMSDNSRLGLYMAYNIIRSYNRIRDKGLTGLYAVEDVVDQVLTSLREYDASKRERNYRGPEISDIDQLLKSLYNSRLYQRIHGELERMQIDPNLGDNIFYDPREYQARREGESEDKFFLEKSQKKKQKLAQAALILFAFLNLAYFSFVPQRTTGYMVAPPVISPNITGTILSLILLLIGVWVWLRNRKIS